MDAMMSAIEERIQIQQGDITEIDTDAIVNAANNDLILGAGVAGAILCKGGQAIQDECNDKGSMPIGYAAITSGGSLKARYVIHAASMGLGGERTTAKTLKTSTAHCLRIANDRELKTIAFQAGGAGVTPLEELLAERIRRFGPITFAEYMRECLYHPVHGYYSQPEARKFADYYTSVDVNPIFGRLLARQFTEMWECLGRPREFTLVEAAAGTGRLATQILDFAQAKVPEFYDSIRYVAVERSPARCDQMKNRLTAHTDRGRCRIELEIPHKIPLGCIFSNELLDALPVHRVIRARQTTQQIGLQEGQQAEAGLEACDWIMEVGRRLERGFVLTIDYGHEASDLFDAHHMAGTVLAYANHRASEEF